MAMFDDLRINPILGLLAELVFMFLVLVLLGFLQKAVLETEWWYRQKLKREFRKELNEPEADSGIPDSPEDFAMYMHKYTSL